MLQHTPEIGALSREMRSVVEKLAERSRVYVLDLLGFGLSDRPDIHYSCDVYVTLCQDFLKLVMANDDTVHAIVDRARDTAASMNDVTGVVATDYTIEDETRVTEISSKGQALDEQVEENCVKCKQKRPVENCADTVIKIGRQAKEGTCLVCATRLFRFVAS